MVPRGATRALVVLMALALSTCSPAGAGPKPSPTPAAAIFDGSIGSAAYSIRVPVGWNGTLFLYSHGYVAQGSANRAVAAPDAAVSSWLLSRHYAIAGSSYSTTGWALEDAFKDQIALLDLFELRVAKPARVIAWGHSLGGIITAGLVQLYPDRFAAAMPMCGVLAGGIATWNTELDAAYAFRTLLAPHSALQLVHIKDPAANLQLALNLFSQAAATQAGRARIALAGALIDLPGWFDPRLPEPAPDDFVARAAGQAAWESRADFAFAFQHRAELEQRAGGNPSWNTGVDYRRMLSMSPDLAEVTALYRGAGLDLDADLRALARGARVKADPAAARYLDSYLSLDGNLKIPVLTVHTTGDGLVIPPNESAYAAAVRASGKGGLLRQLYVHRAGHCVFTSAETIAAFQLLIERLDNGSWDDGASKPAALNATAQALGETMNSFFGIHAAPAFIDFTPAPYPRPFAKGTTLPG